MPLTGGTRLGPYEILAPIGAGGMGEVYKARDTRLDRVVAVKVAGENFSERFEREARAVAALNHPHICTLHDVGPNYLVMEYIEGAPLEGPLPLAEALRLAVQIAEALDAAHKKGITHRDLKPANILVTKAGGNHCVKLLDFGLARFAPTAPAGGETVTLAMTTPGTILGTFQYMSPEQLEAKEADARSDIFTFGAVLYEMLTGRRAFEGKSQASLISAIMTSEPAPLAALQPMTPAALERVIKKCLAKDPDRRWQSASDLADELKWIAAGGGEVPRQTEARPTKLPWAIAVIAAVVFAASLLLMYLYLRRAPAEQSATKLSVLPPASATISSDYAPAISPDGRKLAFVARDSSGKTLLWVRPLDSLTAQPLAGTEEARQPFWSPDSRFLGFFSQNYLRKIDTSGGPPQTLCDCAAITLGGTWSSDGVIAFSGSNNTAIATVAAGGGQPKPITALDRSRQERGHGFPNFLPDGRHFLYLALSGKRENTGIYVGSLDSKDTKRLLSIQSEVRYAPPGFLLFVRDGTLLAQPFNATRLELSGDPFPIAEQVISEPIFGDGMFSVSGNGVLVYRSGAVSGNRQLTWFDRAGKQLELVGPPGEYLNPELSPDGKRVAVERKSAQEDRDIYLLELSGGDPKRFTFNPADDYYPVWSPDGSRVVFASNREGSYGLYLKPSRGPGNEEPLLNKSAFDIAPFSWSSDGRFLVYRRFSAKGYSDVWGFALFGDRKPFPFLRSEEFDQALPKLSPDGHWVAYISTESGRWEVYIQSFPKPEGKSQISTSGGVYPRWSRDGKELFYLAPDERLMAVAVQGGSNLEAGAPRALFEARMLGGVRTIQGFRQQYDVSPDGRRFLINVPVGDEAGSPITLVQNWTAGLKK